MSEPNSEQHSQPHLPAKPEPRRGVVTNPLVVSNARGDRSSGDRPRKGKPQSADGPTRRKKGNRNQNQQNGPQNGHSNSQNSGQNPNAKGKRKNANANPSATLHHTTSAGDKQDLNKILYPDMFDESGNRKAAPVPVTPKGDAYSGSSFHSAPAASSLPRPSFAASPLSAGVAGGIPGVAPVAASNTPPPAAAPNRMVPGPPPVWNGPAPAGGHLHADMHMPMQGMPMMHQAPPHMPMMPQGYSYGYYPPYGYNMPMNYNGYYYPPPSSSVGAVGAPNE